MKAMMRGIGVLAGLVGALPLPAGCALAKERALKDIRTIPASCKNSPYGPGDYLRVMEYGGRKRRYIVHVPPGYDRGHPVPVVMYFHGGGASAINSRPWLGFDALADQKGFIMVYPYGTGILPRRLLTFNAGSCCGYAMKHNVDDVGFTRAMLDELGRTFCVDPKRVYSTGYSNGAMMSYRLACEMADRIAAIGTVGGTLGTNISCSPSRPVPVIHFHGTGDPYEPFKGGKGEKSFPGRIHKTVFRGVQDTMKTWARIIGASPAPTRKTVRGAATEYVYGGGRNGSEVVLWEIKGGGHTWPGARSMPMASMLGPINRDISATQLMWKFFEQHPIR
jgi:polyhydroxybutyrate depolymerase